MLHEESWNILYDSLTTGRLRDSTEDNLQWAHKNNYLKVVQIQHFYDMQNKKSKEETGNNTSKG